MAKAMTTEAMMARLKEMIEERYKAYREKERVTEISRRTLISLIPPEEKDKILSNDECTIGHDFLGFVDVYHLLSKLIPYNYTVIDLGCGYNAQCYFFSNHKEYLAIDVLDRPRFKTPNCTIIKTDIESFINSYNPDDTTFAICNYVPISDTLKTKVRKKFKNIFMFYPA